jgi:acetate kinase
MILVLNPGSSSLKYKLYTHSLDVVKTSEVKVLPGTSIKNHYAACQKVVSELGDDLGAVSKIGIRVVHGGSLFNSTTEIDKKVIGQLKKTAQLAPLHNPPAIKVIDFFAKKLKKAKMYACFDTSFYKDMPIVNQLYAIPESIAKKYSIRRYGFHGISHKYVIDVVDPKHEYRVISIHLGGGCSITSIDKGKVINTSMGFTPDEGLVMQTRSGDIDPGLVLYIVGKLGFRRAKEMIENKSGLAGLTGCTGEMLDVLEMAGEKIEIDNYKPADTNQKDEEKAHLALDIYTQRIRRYLGAYSTEMGGVDIIAFTGKIGAGSTVIRNKIMNGLGFLRYLKTDIVEPNEELAIAKEIVNE